MNKKTSENTIFIATDEGNLSYINEPFFLILKKKHTDDTLFKAAQSLKQNKLY